LYKILETKTLIWRDKMQINSSLKERGRTGRRDYERIPGKKSEDDGNIQISD
jgi:hypothetical protein